MQQIDVVAIKGMLHNWGRWARGDYRGGGGHCGSAEHRYVAPRPDDEAQARKHGEMRVDVDQAEVIDAAIGKLRYAQDRKFLVMMYERGLNDHAIARQFRIPPPLVGPFHLRVIGALACVLDQALPRRGSCSVRSMQPAGLRWPQEADITRATT